VLHGDLAEWHGHSPGILAPSADSPLACPYAPAAARRLLERDFRSLQEVSVAVGDQDVAFFRTIFQRHTGATPGAYRRRFGR
jgi:hypothetical protein